MYGHYILFMSKYILLLLVHPVYCCVCKIAECQVKEEQLDNQKERQENMDSRGGKVTY